MREIKFRAWLKDSRRMVDEPYFFEVYHYSDGNRLNQKAWRCYEDWRHLEDGGGWECEIMQFTGLKDKNGKDIYEGDVIQVNKDKIMPVVYDNASFRTPYYQSNYILEGWEQSVIEVVGNIYENPELLTPHKPF